MLFNTQEDDIWLLLFHPLDNVSLSLIQCIDSTDIPILGQKCCLWGVPCNRRAPVREQAKCDLGPHVQSDNVCQVDTCAISKTYYGEPRPDSAF